MSEEEVLVGKILAFKGSWGSGIATLVVEDDKGEKHNISCDNGPTVRALESCFGDFITDGHTADGEGPIGKWIEYALTDWGTLSGFNPIEEVD